jgi:hypothetical protein
MLFILGAFLTLFCCLHVSDFDVVTSGFTSTTSNNSRLFFALWYAIGVLLMLNIVKSFFLGDFMSLLSSERERKKNVSQSVSASLRQKMINKLARSSFDSKYVQPSGELNDPFRSTFKLVVEKENSVVNDSGNNNFLNYNPLFSDSCANSPAGKIDAQTNEQVNPLPDIFFASTAGVKVLN